MAAGNPIVYHGKLAGTRYSAFSVEGSILIKDDVDSSNPPSGHKKLVAKSDGLYSRDASGTDTKIGSGSSGGALANTVQITAGEDLDQYDAVYCEPRSGSFYKAYVGGSETVAVAVGIITESGGILQDDPGEMTLLGQVTGFSWGFYAANTVYLSETPGQVTNSQPSTVKVLGFMIDNSTLWFDPQTSSSQASSSSEIQGTSGQVLSQYDIVYLDTSDGHYRRATNNGTDLEANAVGTVTQSSGLGNPETGSILLNGLVTNDNWSWTPGATLYLDVDGGMTETQPDISQYVVKPLGFAVSETQIWFSPDLGLKVSEGGGGSPSGGSGTTLADTFTLSSHGFGVGQVLYKTSGSWDLAIATSDASAEAIGVISAVTTDTFTLVFAGVISGLTGGTDGAVGFLSESTAGDITTTEPDASLYVSKPILIYTSATTAVVNIMRGVRTPA
jgi:hypothetical protein